MNIFSVWEGAGARWAAWMWPMAWQVGLLAVLLWLVSVPLRKSPASVRYFLWLLLFVKLLVSPALSTPWSAGTILSRLPVDVVVRPAGPASEIQAPAANGGMQALSVGRGRPIVGDVAPRQTGVAATAELTAGKAALRTAGNELGLELARTHPSTARWPGLPV
jgi:hypothetical protein